jgi:hypothetical protein
MKKILASGLALFIAGCSSAPVVLDTYKTFDKPMLASELAYSYVQPMQKVYFTKLKRSPELTNTLIGFGVTCERLALELLTKVQLDLLVEYATLSTPDYQIINKYGQQNFNDATTSMEDINARCTGAIEFWLASKDLGIDATSETNL